MNPQDDEWDEDGIEDEEAIALSAVEAWLDVEGDDELAQASREALAAIAQEALAKNDRREAREAAARRRRLAQDRAEADERFARREAERVAQQAHQRAVEEAHARVVPVDPRQPRRAAQPSPAPFPVGRRVGSALVSARVARPVMPVRAERHPLPVERFDEDADGTTDADDFADVADDFREAATEAARVVLADVVPPALRPVSRPVEEPIRFPLASDAPPLTGADLTAWRSRHGLTQQAAADRLGVRQGTVSKAESRGGALLGPALRDALADLLAEDRSPA